jgi:S1-C subfamily serine protease
MAALSPRYIATLALVAGGILVVGSLVRPSPKKDAAPAPSEGDLARLAQLSERRSLDNQSAFFAGVADRVASALVRLPEAGTTGIVWETNLIVTAGAASLGAASTIEMGTARLTGTPAAFGPTSPVVGIGVPPPAALVPPSRPALPPRAGDWVVAVWKSEQPRSFAAGNLDAEATSHCGEASVHELLTTIPLAPAMAGGGLFDTDGNLVALLAPCGSRLAALAVSNVDTLLSGTRSPEGRLLGVLGLRVEPMTEAEAAYFKQDAGVIVREVWSGYPADTAGLEPGDQLLSIGETAVTAPADVFALATPTDTPVAVTVRRRGARREIDLQTVAGAEPATTPLGLVWAEAPPGYVIAAVAPGSAAARAGIQPGDRLLRIDQQEPASRTQVERLLSGAHGGPVFVEFERRGRHWGVLLS